jgi:Fe-S oxidoreductase
MYASIEEQVLSLDDMDFAALTKLWLELYDEPSRSKSCPFMRKRLAWRIQCLAEGGLSEKARRRAHELENDADLRIRHLAKPQSTPKATLVAAVQSPSQDSRLPEVGTQLVRIYKGRKIEVTLLNEGFKYGGKVYSSLSAIATEITGTRWNGYTFFGLKKKG